MRDTFIAAIASASQLWWAIIAYGLWTGGKIPTFPRRLAVLCIMAAPTAVWLWLSTKSLTGAIDLLFTGDSARDNLLLQAHRAIAVICASVLLMVVADRIIGGPTQKGDST